ncbi:MAG: hypothetical protein GY858_09550 [Candidatus Omnitrophica bacterium]|nr:hypothetical protein [Candidatus Omnitrophota bacterium]
MKIKLEDNLAWNKRQIILEAYRRYLLGDYEWTLFFNANFRKFVSYETAKKEFKRFIKYLNKNDEIYFDSFVRCLVFYERHSTSSAGIHIHALIDRIDPKHAEIINNKAKKFFGGTSLVEGYNPLGGASYYLIKKIGTKDLVAQEFYIINSKVRP